MHIKFKDGFETDCVLYFQIGITDGILAYLEVDEKGKGYQRVRLFKEDEVESIELFHE